ncbi:MAG TPA: hypothetical protein VHB21_06025, partial [Minicystis sp.]|nr:hypothetical protein [Minicystis sp.]
FDTWYSIEEEIKLNTPGASDGYINVWVDGVKDPGLSPQDIDIRGTHTEKWGILEIGRQLDPCDMTAMYTCSHSMDGSEHRYWDDVIVSHEFITP